MGNYRPIALLSILYKLFSKVVCGRIGCILDAAQPVDQAGFRTGFGCDDHLLTLVLVAEKMSEFQLPLWIALVDYQKAFDTVEHGGIWEAMASMGVPRIYIRTFVFLYSEQAASVFTSTKSWVFQIKRGTKLGDPCSPKLFSTVLQLAMEDVRAKWQKKHWGIDLGVGRTDRLTNLRLAVEIVPFLAYCTTHLLSS